jgi:hypothetical protein
MSRMFFLLKAPLGEMRTFSQSRRAFRRGETKNDTGGNGQQRIAHHVFAGIHVIRACTVLAARQSG